MKSRNNISWNPNLSPEEEDRLAYLKLSGQEKWDYLMRLILATCPYKKITFDKRNIEWT